MMNMPSSLGSLRRAGLSVLALLGTLTTGCVRNIPAPRPPEPTIPMTSDDEVPEGEAGMARVIIGTDVTARVDRVGGHFDQIVHRGRETRSYVTDVDTLLCASTPCTVALPYGDYELKLSAVSDPTRASTATIRVRHRTEIVNHVLGMNRRSTTGTLGGVLSVIGSVVVGIGVGVGLVQAQEHRTAHTATDSTMPVLVGIGGTTLMTGGVMMAASPTIRQEGATRQWAPRSLPPAVPSATAPVSSPGERGTSVRMTF